MRFNTFAMCLIICIAIIFYFDDNLEHLETLGPDNRLIVGDTSGNLESIDFNKVAAPKGLIAMWSGDTVPSGWNLCDGNAGKDVNGLRIPDLRGRFVVMVNLQANPSSNKDNPTGSVLNVYQMGSTGGEQLHALTEGEMPSHGHELKYLFGSGTGTAYGNYMLDHEGGHTMGKTSRRTEVTGGGQPHNNLPPYYALAYIIKTV